MSFSNGDYERLIPGPAGDLESLLQFNEDSSNVVICCHPHPQFGGTMTNKVVHTLHRVFKDRGMSTIRFNFRGVGKSHGSYAEGDGEIDDLLSIIQWVKTNFPHLKIALAGFSFGAFISLKVAQLQNFQFLISVAPPVSRIYFENIVITSMPWIVIQPLDDDVVDPQASIAWYYQHRHPLSRLVEVADCSHFFHGKLIELKLCLNQSMDELGL